MGVVSLELHGLHHTETYGYFDKSSSNGSGAKPYAKYHPDGKPHASERTVTADCGIVNVVLYIIMTVQRSSRLGKRTSGDTITSREGRSGCCDDRFRRRN